MKFDLIAGFFISLLFIAVGVFSLLLLFNPRLRSRYLKKNERQRWHLMPVKKSDVQQRREIGEGMLMAGAVLTVLIFLPLGLMIFIWYIWHIIISLSH
jgi:hypothetical protein